MEKDSIQEQPGSRTVASGMIFDVKQHHDAKCYDLVRAEKGEQQELLETLLNWIGLICFVLGYPYCSD